MTTTQGHDHGADIRNGIDIGGPCRTCETAGTEPPPCTNWFCSNQATHDEIVGDIVLPYCPDCAADRHHDATLSGGVIPTYRRISDGKVVEVGLTPPREKVTQ